MQGTRAVGALFRRFASLSGRVVRKQWRYIAPIIGTLLVVTLCFGLGWYAKTTSIAGDDETQIKIYKELPIHEVAQIEPSHLLFHPNGEIQGSLYNGSQYWRLRSVLVEISIYSLSFDVPRIQRLYKIDCLLDPLAIGTDLPPVLVPVIVRESCGMSSLAEP